MGFLNIAGVKSSALGRVMLGFFSFGNEMFGFKLGNVMFGLSEMFGIDGISTFGILIFGVKEIFDALPNTDSSVVVVVVVVFVSLLAAGAGVVASRVCCAIPCALNALGSFPAGVVVVVVSVIELGAGVDVVGVVVVVDVVDIVVVVYCSAPTEA